MIVDAHTHAFPPEFLERRDELVARDPTFAELYRDPRARIATAADVLSSMDAAGVDVAVIAGFAWRDPVLCRMHNDYLLRSAEASGGRLLGLCSLPLADQAAAHLEVTLCVRGGASGFGELRPASQEVSLADPAVSELLGWAAEAYDAPLLLSRERARGARLSGQARA